MLTISASSADFLLSTASSRSGDMLPSGLFGAQHYGPYLQGSSYQCLKVGFYCVNKKQHSFFMVYI